MRRARRPLRHAPRAIVGVLALAACLELSACGSSDPPAPTTTTKEDAQLGPAFEDMKKVPGVLITTPPWPANAAELQQRLRAIGLEPLTEEGQVVHTHQHLDLFVDGEKVTVPANIGIDPAGAFLSALHTHDTTGILHVESPTVTSFSLGQFFAVWGLRLDRDCIGGLCARGDKQLRAWVNGKPVAADPTRIVLDARQQIVLAYGTSAQMPKPVPAKYTFPAGL